ncbi:hypothetical protein [Bacteroides clarus]|nr:hypothetical protein [Bacteroides clarus]
MKKIKETTEILSKIKEIRGGNIVLYTVSAMLIVTGLGLAAYTKWT